MNTHNNEKKVARVVVVNPDKSIILNRRPDWSKQAANKLQVLGGKQEPTDESEQHAAQREILQELGITASLEKFIFLCKSENNGWITTAFILLLDEAYDVNSMPNHGEFESIEVVPFNSILDLIESGEIAFDHPEILKQFLEIFNK